jgi:hypothetical protein
MQNEMTKAQLVAALEPLDVIIPRKATLAQLQALYAEHMQPTEAQVEAALVDQGDAPAPKAATGTGLKIEKDREERNGVKRPSAGGKCRAIWDALDAVVASTGNQPTSQLVKGLAAEQGWNPSNASIEFYQWRKFNGIKGRTPKAAPAEAPAA